MPVGDLFAKLLAMLAAGEGEVKESGANVIKFSILLTDGGAKFAALQARYFSALEMRTLSPSSEKAVAGVLHRPATPFSGKMAEKSSDLQLQSLNGSAGLTLLHQCRRGPESKGRLLNWSKSSDER